MLTEWNVVGAQAHDADQQMNRAQHHRLCAGPCPDKELIPLVRIHISGDEVLRRVHVDVGRRRLVSIVIGRRTTQRAALVMHDRLFCVDKVVDVVGVSLHQTDVRHQRTRYDDMVGVNIVRRRTYGANTPGEAIRQKRATGAPKFWVECHRTAATQDCRFGHCLRNNAICRQVSHDAAFWHFNMLSLIRQSRRLLIAFNPRPAGGGAFERPPPPLRFFEDSKKRRRAAPPGFHPPYPHLFRNICENFDPMPCEVRSPGQVK